MLQPHILAIDHEDHDKQLLEVDLLFNSNTIQKMLVNHPQILRLSHQMQRRHLNIIYQLLIPIPLFHLIPVLFQQKFQTRSNQRKHVLNAELGKDSRIGFDLFFDDEAFGLEDASLGLAGLGFFEADALELF